MTLPAARVPAAVHRSPVRGAGGCRLVSAAALRLQQAADVDRRDRQTTDTRPLHRPCTAYYRSTQPCIPPGSLNRVPASAGVRAGMSPVLGGR